MGCIVSRRGVAIVLPDGIVQDLLDDGAKELVAYDLPGVQVDARQLRVVINYSLRGGAPSDTPGFPPKALLVLDPASSKPSTQ